jgi:putative DNA methylase
MNHSVIPFSLKEATALIERLLPVQKLSAEAYKEQEGKQGKTLTTLGSYWKGRKPLILNKACILGCLLPATDNLARDLEIFEKLMAMDDESFVVRWPHRPKPKEILTTLSIARIADYFTVEPANALPLSAPVEWSKLKHDQVKVGWREDVTELERRRLEVQMLPKMPYREQVEQAMRPEEVMGSVHDHIWDLVNVHLGTNAQSLPELVEQLGIMRFGRRPRVADTFCGSGQIPFEAARLGCDVYASDINPVACMLTWGAFHVIGGPSKYRKELWQAQEQLAAAVQKEIDDLRLETDGHGWKPKTFLYCIEVTCPQTGWHVPLLATRIISKGKSAIAELIPDVKSRRFSIRVRSGVSERDLRKAEKGTVLTDGRGQEPYLAYLLNGVEHRTKITTLRGDFIKPGGEIGNRLRLWEKGDFKPHSDDIYRERLYAIQWMRPKKKGKGYDYEFRSITSDDLSRETIVEEFIAKHLAGWQAKGWLPDMRIEPGDKTDEPIRTRGWTHWHHLFAPRQLLFLGLSSKYIHGRADELVAPLLIFLARLCDWSSKLCRYGTGAARESVAQTFYNQALNALFTYGVRSFTFAKTYLLEDLVESSVAQDTKLKAMPASEWDSEVDIYVTDPPYGDAVKYDEILEFFIAWLRKNPPPEFADWVWDSRRSLAIKGEGEDFRRGMVAAYKRMTECMSANGMQVIMFTHQSGSIWADMANIVWASGLHVTAAWYVVTEADSALREGSYVKGTVLLVLRKRHGTHKTTRDDLAWEIQEEVEAQVNSLAGLNQEAKGLYRDENVFEDADIQMAGYAAALRVLTRYSVIDGRDMTAEAMRPRVKGETTFVDGLIAFAVDTANQCLVPQGIPKAHWDKLSGPERFYLKLLDMEARGAKTLDNYQNFAKAFKVRDFRPFLASQKANDARLKGAVEFARAEMGEGSELHQSALRAVLYAVMELVRNVDADEVLAHLTLNIPNYYGDMTQRALAVELADYLATHLDSMRPDEASAARVLCELVKSQRLG